jgi:hypothetical protein
VVPIPLLGSYAVVGIYREIRVFCEAYPVLFPLAFLNVCEAFGRPLRERMTLEAEALGSVARSFARDREAVRAQDDR